MKQLYIKYLFLFFYINLPTFIDEEPEKDRKYEYQLNYVRAFHIIRNYLKEKGGKNPPDIESLIAKEILPIRPNRQNERKVKAKSPVSFNYRYD